VVDALTKSGARPSSCEGNGFGETASARPYDEVGDRFGFVSKVPKPLRQLRKFCGRFFGQRLPGLARL
jgi:hypothetical protein